MEFARDAESLEEYLVVQRHFEEPDDGRCYVETDDPNFCGHFHLSRAVLSQNRFHLWIGSRKIEVSFTASEESYNEAKKVLQLLIPRLEVRPGQGG